MIRAHLQVENSPIIFVLIDRRILFCCTKHFCPAHSVLKLHEPFFVLISLHEHSRHFYTSKPLPLRQRYVFLVIRFVVCLLFQILFHLFHFVFQFLYSELESGFHGIQRSYFFPQNFVLAIGKNQKYTYLKLYHKCGFKRKCRH